MAGDGRAQPQREDQPGGPVVTASAVTFTMADEPGIDGVRLELDFPLRPADPVGPAGPVGPDLVRTGARWSLRVPRPEVDRLEYQFTVRRADRVEWMTDPENGSWVPNPFGRKSEILFPEYRAPGWLDTDLSGSLDEVSTDPGRLEQAVPTGLWVPRGLADGDRAPLLLVHDGSDMAERGSLLRWATRAAARRPLRVALLDPIDGQRDQWYAANSDYADHVTQVVLPALRARIATSTVVGLGASLGAVAMLQIQRLGALDGAMLQSGSFFTADLDPQESRYRFFDRLCAAVTDMANTPGPPVPTVITVGAVEENRANNEQMGQCLAAQRYPLAVRIVRDAHTMIGWRDAWSPALDDLIDTVGAR